MIAGLIDDDEAIQAQWIYGYQVLGGIKDLPAIVEKTGARMPCQLELSFCQRLLDFLRPGVSQRARV